MNMEGKRQEIREWIQGVIGTSLSDDGFFNDLADGEILCRLINKLEPLTILETQIDPSIPSRKADLLLRFLKACQSVGVNKQNLFAISDLTRGENLAKVLNCLISLRETCSVEGRGMIPMPSPSTMSQTTGKRRRTDDPDIGVFGDESNNKRIRPSPLPIGPHGKVRTPRIAIRTTVKEEEDTDNKIESRQLDFTDIDSMNTTESEQTDTVTALPLHSSSGTPSVIRKTNGDMLEKSTKKRIRHTPSHNTPNVGGRRTSRAAGRTTKAGNPKLLLKKALGDPIKSLQKQCSLLKKEASTMLAEMHATMKTTLTALVAATTKHDTTRHRLEIKLDKSNKRCRTLLNRVIELQGNIRVFCRIRPLSDSEKKRGDSSIIEFAEEYRMGLTKESGSGSYLFDRIFDHTSTQEGVFEHVGPFVECAVDGYNVCVFAYGQTGSGKTYTMEGTPSDRGVNYRALVHLFHAVKDKGELFNFEVGISVLEIYNEMPRDLLAVGAKKLDVRQGPNGPYVPDLTKHPVNSVDDVQTLMAKAHANRSTGMTNMNQHSSRSHCLLFINIEGVHRKTQERTQGKLVLIDLAGSERVKRSEAVGQGLKEAQHINRSLAALGDVISALKLKSAHVPYRNSKLTYLLQECLGTGKCLMFCQISPSTADTNETLCSLKFATRVQGVTLGQAKRNLVSGPVKLNPPKLPEESCDGSKSTSQVKDLQEQLKKQMQKVLRLQVTLRLKDKEIASLKEQPNGRRRSSVRPQKSSRTSAARTTSRSESANERSVGTEKADFQPNRPSHQSDSSMTGDQVPRRLRRDVSSISEKEEDSNGPSTSHSILTKRSKGPSLTGPSPICKPQTLSSGFNALTPSRLVHSQLVGSPLSKRGLGSYSKTRQTSINNKENSSLPSLPSLSSSSSSSSVVLGSSSSLSSSFSSSSLSSSASSSSSLSSSGTLASSTLLPTLTMPPTATSIAPLGPIAPTALTFGSSVKRVRFAPDVVDKDEPRDEDILIHEDRLQSTPMTGIKPPPKSKPRLSLRDTTNLRSQQMKASSKWTPLREPSSSILKKGDKVPDTDTPKPTKSNGSKGDLNFNVSMTPRYNLTSTSLTQQNGGLETIEDIGEMLTIESENGVYADENRDPKTDKLFSLKSNTNGKAKGTKRTHRRSTGLSLRKGERTKQSSMWSTIL